MAGGQLVKQYPGAVSKRIDMELLEVKGPRSLNHPLPAGTFMGAVGMENSSLQRIDLSDKVRLNRLTAELPAGDWKVMIFTLNPDSSSGRNHCDYLSPEAVNRFIELTYEKYYQAFPGHFGTTIDYAFYDEPCLRWVEGARTWTGEFKTSSRQSTVSVRFCIILPSGLISVPKPKRHGMPYWVSERNCIPRDSQRPSTTGAAHIKFSSRATSTRRRSLTRSPRAVI
jgi:hypothetical protein